MEKPNIADKRPLIFEVEEGKRYAWCACGSSKKEKGALCDGSHITTSFKPHMFVADASKKVALCMCKHTKNPPFCDGTHATV